MNTNKVVKVQPSQLPAMAQALVKACGVREPEATKAKYRWSVKNTIVTK